MYKLERLTRIFASLTALLLSACATQISVGYNSSPQGATLMQDGQAVGVTPITLRYNIEQSFKDGGCQLARGTSVMWASGAKAEVSSLRLCKNIGTSQLYTFMRPDVPGREIDLNYALQRERNQMMATQMQIQAIQAQQALTNQQQQNEILRNSLNRPINCTSNAYGNQVNTNCY